VARQHIGRRELALLGHPYMHVIQTVSGARWFACCDCGWVSSTARTQADAVGATLWHSRKVAEAWARTGLPLPRTARPVVRPESEMRRRHPHYDAYCRACEKAGEPTPGQDSARQQHQSHNGDAGPLASIPAG